MGSIHEASSFVSDPTPAPRPLRNNGLGVTRADFPRVIEAIQTDAEAWFQKRAASPNGLQSGDYILFTNALSLSLRAIVQEAWNASSLTEEPNYDRPVKDYRNLAAS